jgi:hypothetical protein
MIEGDEVDCGADGEPAYGGGVGGGGRNVAGVFAGAAGDGRRWRRQEETNNGWSGGAVTWSDDNRDLAEWTDIPNLELTRPERGWERGVLLRAQLATHSFFFESTRTRTIIL